MRPKPHVPRIARRRYLHNLIWFVLLLAISSLVGCRLTSTIMLPTLVPTLEPSFPDQPSPTTRASREAPPATYTPGPTQDLAAAGLPVRSLTQTPWPTSTLAPSPTPLLVTGNFPQRIDGPFVDTPPIQTDCQENGFIFHSRFPSNVAGPWRDYHAYLPPCYGQDGRAYPVLYLIHGSIQDDSHWLDLGLAQYLDAGITSGRFPPLIAIMPNSGRFGNYTSGGWNSIEGITVNSLLPYVDDNYCSWQDPAGRSIGGISRGGYWALEIAFKYPDLFGAVAGHSSQLRFETDPAKHNPLATYANTNLSGMRIWLDRGEKDFLRVGQDQLHTLLLEAGISHVYQVNEGGHNEAYWVDHLAEYIDWQTALWPRDRLDYPICD
ncbi:MAG TPA: alpha/beta hydrolase-fold protein [Patescibacteria group bacterium]|jgi:enterochelin esterase-like enzyme|nr:alpha/beta hydrolase-fold protein [Patescibacteria group bacterium]